MDNKVQIVSNIEIETEKIDRIGMTLKEAYDLYLSKIPEDVLEAILSDNHIDYVAENLKSHSRQSLMEKISKEWGCFLKGFGANFKLGDIDQFYILFKENVNVLWVSSDVNFKNLLLFYNYFVTKVDETNNIIKIEPTFPNQIDNISSICYHFAWKNDTEKILNSGLRCKNSRGGYRDYPERIYLYNPSNFSLFKEDSFKLRNFIRLIRGEDNLIKAREKLSIIKVDFNRLHQNNLDFYQDVTLAEVYPSVFTYNNIPKECLTDVTSEKMWDFILET